MLTPAQTQFFEKKQSFGLFYGRKRRKEIKELFSKHFSLPAAKEGRLNALDIGFGKVSELYVLMDHLRNAVLVGLDVYEKKMKSLARELKDLGNMRVLRGDMDHMDFEEEYFDVIFAFNVLHLSQNPGEVFKGIYRILKKKSAFIFSLDMFEGSSSFNPEKIESLRVTGNPVHILPTKTWEQYAVQAGFKIQKTYTSAGGLWYAVCGK